MTFRTKSLIQKYLLKNLVHLKVNQHWSKNSTLNGKTKLTLLWSFQEGLEIFTQGVYI